jgi:hypothetical protein
MEKLLLSPAEAAAHLSAVRRIDHRCPQHLRGVNYQTNRDRQSWHCRSLESRLDQSLAKANSRLYANTSRTMLLIMLGYGRGVAQPARQG